MNVYREPILSFYSLFMNVVYVVHNITIKKYVLDMLARKIIMPN